MSNIITLPTKLAATEAWERYAALVRQANADRQLWADLRHCQDMARAHRDWMHLFLRSDSAA